MARIARVAAPGFPHHITQRGNRRQRTFFDAADCRAYLALHRCKPVPPPGRKRKRR